MLEDLHKQRVQIQPSLSCHFHCCFICSSLTIPFLFVTLHQYYEAVYLMKQYIETLPATEVDAKQLLQVKITEYERTARRLMSDDASVWEVPTTVHSPAGHTAVSSLGFSSASLQLSPPRRAEEWARQAHEQLSQAIDMDEKFFSSSSAAAAAATSSTSSLPAAVQSILDAYTKAAELYLRSLQADEGHTHATMWKRRLTQVLDRMEALRNRSKPSQSLSSERTFLPQVSLTASSSSSLTRDEIQVLKKSSLMTSGIFLPWTDADAVDIHKESMQSNTNTKATELYTDPDGWLPLSPRQTERLYKWARPAEICRIRQQQQPASSRLSITTVTPVMVGPDGLSPYSIQQEFVTDCSFIASLCMAAAWENQHKKPLITNILYPHNKKGQWVVHPQGKYLVKLWLNGVARSVFIDDYLPIDNQGNLLCSHSASISRAGRGGTSILELWVPLLEKAYMKLCGGYDFPGSNSGVDLFSLTGWIPERILFAQDPTAHGMKDHETHPERAWERIRSASAFGDCLMTVSTQAEISPEEADRVGLVTGHAYAVLRVVQTRNGTRLLQVKNPWRTKSWRGRFSRYDTVNWSDASLCTELGYDAQKAMDCFGLVGKIFCNTFKTFTCHGIRPCFRIVHRRMRYGRKIKVPWTIVSILVKIRNTS
jgi:hypothetical protein